MGMLVLGFKVFVYITICLTVVGVLACCIIGGEFDERNGLK